MAQSVAVATGADLKADFTVGSASNGIAPLTEDVTLTIGSFSTTIPAGSFVAMSGLNTRRQPLDRGRDARRVDSIGENG
jgi:hypothetical protein